jgi:hypothetical protein
VVPGGDALIQPVRFHLRVPGVEFDVGCGVERSPIIED